MPSSSLEETAPHPAAPPALERKQPWGKLTGKIALAVASSLVFSVSGYAWAQYNVLDNGIHKSGALAGEQGSLGKDTNILIMALDSRLDENGNPLPPDIYNALQAGNQNDGGNNANVLMLLHVPGDGSKATSISVARDDFVTYPQCYDGQCSGKVKEAYGLAFAGKHDQLVGSGMKDKTEIERESRDAGRKAEIDTIRKFLGGVPVDHFVEVTMVAFFQIAQVVQPITVCLNEDTQDTFSGANFHKGNQQINAQQAVEFVRQRRDLFNRYDFNELDRERRQQAFISSLAFQLKRSGTFANPTKLQGLINVASQNIAVDDNLDLLQFAQQASNLTSGNIQFITLPIQGNATRNGEDVNIVNEQQIQGIVRQAIGGGLPPPPPSTGPDPSSSTVDVLNASGHNGLASELEKGLVAKGYTQGSPSTDPRIMHSSSIHYSGDPAAANALASLLGGIPVVQDSSVSSGHLEIVVGTDFTMPSSLDSGGNGSSGSGGAPEAGSQQATAATATVAPATTVPTAPGPDGSGQPSTISGGGVPCVK